MNKARDELIIGPREVFLRLLELLISYYCVKYYQGSQASWKMGNTREFRFTHSRLGNVLENKKNGQNLGFTLEIY
jgi:hypothetical protein